MSYEKGLFINVPVGNPTNPESESSRTFDINEYDKAMLDLNSIIGIADVPLNFVATAAMLGAGLIGQSAGMVLAGLQYPLAVLQHGVYDPASDSLLFQVQTPCGFIATVNDWSSEKGGMLYRDAGDISTAPKEKSLYAIACDDGAVNVGAFKCAHVFNGITNDTLTASGDHCPVACIFYSGQGSSGIELAEFNMATQAYDIVFDREYIKLPIIVASVTAVDGSVASVMLDELDEAGVTVTLYNSAGQKIRNDSGFSIFGFTSLF